jgi:hypothetical protein
MNLWVVRRVVTLLRIRVLHITPLSPALPRTRYCALLAAGKALAIFDFQGGMLREKHICRESTIPTTSRYEDCEQQGVSILNNCLD